MSQGIVVPEYYSKAPVFCTNNMCPMRKLCLMKRSNYDRLFKDVRYETYLLNYFHHWKSGAGFNCSALTQHKYMTIANLMILQRWGYFFDINQLVKIKDRSKKNG